MEPKSGYADYAGAQVVFPIDLQLGFVAESVLVTNNTPATLYLSSTNVAPTSSTKQFTVPPRTTIPLRKWGGDHIYVGSDGSAIGSLDSLTIQYTEDTRNPFAGNAIPVGLGSQIKSLQRGIIAFGVVASGAASVVDQALATPVNTSKAFEINEGISASGGVADGSVEGRLQLLNANQIRGVAVNRTAIGLDCNLGYTVVELV